MINYKFGFIKLRKSFVSYHHYIIVVMNKIPKESNLTYLEIEGFLEPVNINVIKLSLWVESINPSQSKQFCYIF